MSTKSSLSLLLIVTLGVFVGTLLALYVAAKVGQNQLQEESQTNPILGLLGL